MPVVRVFTDEPAKATDEHTLSSLRHCAVTLTSGAPDSDSYKSKPERLIEIKVSEFSADTLPDDD
ncbi:hypothetical protein [Pseudomonas gingeri]|uniref:Uncharacterized protein n=1 Tax=Pseudomonas gingeri TaxID=117681 RepID=A0A7Y7YIZ7_9PSED|nr:hypothetical protein [Pseudomonas gingeri]NWA02001.1 hypothetical protein [Pseudomonas gingeri]NWA18009.1 hypothetical protein [Pseudomonas gingeri]NWA53336.1 hypothetical protein [Pseudomonas gingeri]NWA95351.1 hypothetical protein [Pseudomonas gingeri]NWB00201.1 hypothetical protein [Pseudomonas gingeri]